MLDHVLIPLDGSELAEKALEHGKRVVGPNGKITLLTVLDIPEYPMYGFYPAPIVIEETDYQTAAKNLVPQAKEYLEKIAQPLRETGLLVSVEVELGEPAGVIVDVAQNRHVDAIVMSTHGRSGFSRWLFGSVTNKVLSATPCPVFVIPGIKKPAKPEEKQAEVSTNYG